MFDQWEIPRSSSKDLGKSREIPPYSPKGPTQTMGNPWKSSDIVVPRPKRPGSDIQDTNAWRLLGRAVAPGGYTQSK